MFKMYWDSMRMVLQASREVLRSVLESKRHVDYDCAFQILRV